MAVEREILIYYHCRMWRIFCYDLIKNKTCLSVTYMVCWHAPSKLLHGGRGREDERNEHGHILKSSTKIRLPDIRNSSKHHAAFHLKPKPEDNYLLRKGKYHCTADLLFDWFGFDPNLCLIQHKPSSWIPTSQTRGQLYRDTSPACAHARWINTYKEENTS